MYGSESWNVCDQEGENNNSHKALYNLYAFSFC